MDINWDGIGAPPVGAICEAKVQHDVEQDWFKAEVKYISLFTVVLNDFTVGELEGEFVVHPDTVKFRPIKTKEQLAAEEREKAIEDMVDDILRNTIGIDHKKAWWCSAALHDAGYRKQENNDAKA